MELEFEIVVQLLYSPDVAPSDYLVFPNFKRWLCGKRFSLNEEDKPINEAYFEGLSKFIISRTRLEDAGLVASSYKLKILRNRLFQKEYFSIK